MSVSGIVNLTSSADISALPVVSLGRIFQNHMCRQWGDPFIVRLDLSVSNTTPMVLRLQSRRGQKR